MGSVIVTCTSPRGKSGNQQLPDQEVFDYR